MMSSISLTAAFYCCLTTTVTGHHTLNVNSLHPLSSASSYPSINMKLVEKRSCSETRCSSLLAQYNPQYQGKYSKYSFKNQYKNQRRIWFELMPDVTRLGWILQLVQSPSSPRHIAFAAPPELVHPHPMS
ncbi:hypothetical protein BDV98DRAFT_176647 [Pterulicium gracile]|uniref:Secreted protein n=1 Tax=Pterulicium gracile TaxID=1884261 RepID=A0A5C3QCP4_9AGAR|nr:hypothetical protein BDV98DRAFT_176647 [Pterula gracilis]